MKREIVEIIDNDNFGNGIGKINEKVIFVAGTIKGEKALIEIDEEKKNYSFGHKLELLEKSTDRIEPLCPFYASCGGCCFQEFSEEAEKKIKNNYIKKMFSDYLVNDIIFSSDLFYRNKATFHVKNNKIGFYQKKSNNILEINNCLLLDEKLNEVLRKLKSIDIPDGEILVRVSKTTREVMIRFDEVVDISSLKDIDSIYVKDKCVYGKSYITEVINDVTYTIYPNSFFQVNTLQMINLYNQVLKYSKSGNNLLDLYCGTGTIAIYLSKYFENVYGIDNVSDAIKNANLNKKINNIKNVDFKCCDAGNVEKSKYDVVVVDPPRRGLSRKVVEILQDINPKTLVYVSCNPNTLKRDIKLFDKYEVKEITPVNMFYRTEHVEIVCVMERK